MYCYKFTHLSTLHYAGKPCLLQVFLGATQASLDWLLRWFKLYYWL